jgi:hypothetical protein
LLIYNRPELTRSAMERIRAARPPRLLVVADGPRTDRPEDFDQCARAREAAAEVDWPCEVDKNYASENLGCARRVSGGLDWAFSLVEEAIVLEDDCLPDETFFPYCQGLLARFRTDVRVMAVSGDNFQLGRRRTPYSYYFSRYPHCWGWATWRRAWEHFDFEMKLWPEFRDGRRLNDLFGNARVVRHWTRVFEQTADGTLDSWAYRWTFACWAQGGLSILPAVNLVSNVGFGDGATHTTRRSLFENLPAERIALPLRHPPFILRDAVADRRTERTLFSPGPFQRLAASWRVRIGGR